MSNRENKYFVLAASILFTFIGLIILMVLLVLFLRVLFGLLSYIPWLTYLYMAGILFFPGCLFLTTYVWFARKTRYHPSLPVRYISWTAFAIACVFWLIILGMDLRVFFTKGYTEIAGYDSFNLLFLASNGALIFFVGIIQALTTEKETDWMNRLPDR